MSRRARWEVLKAVYPRYRGAARGDKRKMLDEFCETTGYQRKTPCGSSTARLRAQSGPAAGGGPRRTAWR
jgi:hypothetical protein